MKREISTDVMSEKKGQCHNFGNPKFEYGYQAKTNSTFTRAKEQVSVKYWRRGINQIK
jgi:hypothetical protein